MILEPVILLSDLLLRIWGRSDHIITKFSSVNLPLYLLSLLIFVFLEKELMDHLLEPLGPPFHGFVSPVQIVKCHERADQLFMPIVLDDLELQLFLHLHVFALEQFEVGLVQVELVLLQGWGHCGVVHVLNIALGEANVLVLAVDASHLAFQQRLRPKLF